MRYVPYNGGISEDQMQWITSQLALSRSLKQRVIIFTHMPLYLGCCRPSGLMWGAEKLLQVLHCSEYCGTVIAVVAGTFKYYSTLSSYFDYNVHVQAMTTMAAMQWMRRESTT